MSKADQLGDSPSFTAATRSRSTRGRLIADATGDQPPPPETRTEPPRTIALSDLAHNPFNPRIDLGELQETADSLLEKGQIQPITVITRQVFLQAHPGNEAKLGSASYVVLDGNRRLAAATLAGLDDLRVDVNDSLASSAADILESALIANLHREDLTPLEEAQTLAKLVEVYGSQRQVARRIGKTHVWVGQRLALLELNPELQEELKAGKLTVEDARKIGKLPQQQQNTAAHEAKTVRKARPPRRRGRGGNGVTTSPNDLSLLDWTDPNSIATALRERLSPEQRKILAELLLRET